MVSTATDHDTPDEFTRGLDAYVVGGAVRDALLGVEAGDRDWVVVGASPQAMVDRGFIPVGGDFPVFLHPLTKEEYALARTERKSGRGYRGFVFHAGPDVTLEQDLQRRDLTVNAIARRPDGSLVDPWGGVADLDARILRHVGPAFAEDPVRILRLARFAARFIEFSVADETLALCRAMVAAGEVDALVPERVWREISRGLMQSRPSRMFGVLAESGALARVAPEWQACFGDAVISTPDEPVRRQGEPCHGEPGQALEPVGSNRASFDALVTLDAAAKHGLPLPARYGLACLCATDAAALHARMRVPVECADFARLTAFLRDALPVLDVSSVLEVIERCDGLRKPDRFYALLQAVSLCRPLDEAQWRTWLETVRAVDAGAVARRVEGGAQAIRAAVRNARLAALEKGSGSI